MPGQMAVVPGKRLEEWGLWILATTVCWVPTLPGMAYVASADLSPGATAGVFAGWGALAGLSQWLWLRRFVRRAVWWIPATAVGGSVGFTLLSVIVETLGWDALQAVLSSEEAAMVAVQAVLGAVVGLSQWLVLQRWVRWAAWWIPATAVGWAVGLGWFIGGIYAVGELALTWGVVFILPAVAGFAVPGALTGLVLLYLVGQKCK